MSYDLLPALRHQLSPSLSRSLSEEAAQTAHAALIAGLGRDLAQLVRFEKQRTAALAELGRQIERLQADPSESVSAQEAAPAFAAAQEYEHIERAYKRLKRSMRQKYRAMPEIVAVLKAGVAYLDAPSAAGPSESDTL